MSSARSNGQFKILKVYNDYDQGGKDLGTRILQFEASMRVLSNQFQCFVDLINLVSLAGVHLMASPGLGLVYPLHSPSHRGLPRTCI